MTLVLAVAGLAACGGGDFRFGGTIQPVDFGNVLIFTSVKESVMWQNQGAKDEVLGTTVRPTPPFEIAPYAPGTAPTTITVDAGGLYFGLFTFKPTVLGLVTGKAKLVGPRHETVNLKGTGVFYISDGNIIISETAGGGAPTQAVDFGKVPVGTSKTLVIFVRNTLPAGAPPVAVATTVNWSLNNQGFTSAPVHGAALGIPANTPTPVAITFTPADVAIYQDSVALKNINGRIVSGIMVQGEGVDG